MAIMDYVLYTYEKCWPDHPFVFHVPWNFTEPTHLINSYGKDRIKLIKTPSPIKGTLRTLLALCEPNEWIWWAMDDKYLLKIKRKENIHNIFSSLHELGPNVSGFMFTRNCNANWAMKDGKMLRFGNLPFREKWNYNQIYQPQLLRARVLSRIFVENEFPEDYFLRLGGKDNPDALLYEKIYEDEIMYSSLVNLLHIAESLAGGKILKNCVRHMSEDGFAVPSISQSNQEIVYD
jgi:hypothetical protein